MLLAVDIGNTNISFGLFPKAGIAARFDIPTRAYNLNRLKRALAKFRPDDVVICSVVPVLTGAMEKDLKGLLGVKPYIIGKDIKVPIKNLYRKPGQVGQDRLVNAYAAKKLYGSPAIVIDLGTALTFDAISKRGEYLGGVILPGLHISLKALYENTALLPKIKLRPPEALIGRDTASSMLSGIVYGLAVLIDNLSRRIKDNIGKKAEVIGTGGDIRLIAKYSNGLDYIDRDLTLKGLSLILFERGQKFSSRPCSKNIFDRVENRVRQ